jgi:hypothetical protein
VPGVVFLAIGLMLQAGATSSVKAVKMSATLVAAQRSSDAAPTDDPPT